MELKLEVPNEIVITCSHKGSGTTIKGTFDTTTLTANAAFLGMVAELRRGFAQSVVRDVSSIERTRLAKDGYSGKALDFLPTGHYIPAQSREDVLATSSPDQLIAALKVMKTQGKRTPEQVKEIDAAIEAASK